MAMAQCASLIAPYALDSRLRGNERSLLLTPFVPAKAGTQGHAVSQQIAAPCHANGAMRFAYCALRAMLRTEARVMANIPDKYLDLLQRKKAFAVLSTLMPDGSPQVTPVWFDYTNGLVRVNTAKGRTKARNLKQGARVAMAIVDPDNPYRYIQIRGRVRRVTEEGAGQHIDSLSKKYLGQDKYPNAQPGEVRLLCEIEPASASGMG